MDFLLSSLPMVLLLVALAAILLHLHVGFWRAANLRGITITLALLVVVAVVLLVTLTGRHFEMTVHLL